jgi:hypothetical protein
MIKKKSYILILISNLFLNLNLNAQPFETVGGAYNIPSVQNSNCEGAEACFTLTNNVLWQQGAVWDLDTLDLYQAFDATFCMFIGADDAGADGFAFVIRSPNSNNYGENGGGIGYGSANGVGAISPSLAIEFDSFYNPDFFDIPEDHTSLVLNGVMNSPPAVSSIPLLPNGANVEDNSFHNARIVWNPITQEISMYFDGFLRFTYTFDFINNIFGGDSKVLWGFTASTGGLSNLQQICFPKIVLEVPDQVICYNDSIEVSYYRENLTEYYWETPLNETLLYWNSSMGTPLVDTSFFTSEPGEYRLFVEFNNKIYSTSFNVIYDNSPPVMLGNDTSFCVGESIVLSDLNGTSWNTRQWSNSTNGNSISVSIPGIYWLQASNYAQCIYRDSIVISNHPLPTLNLLPFDSIACSPGDFKFEAQTENGTSITWVFEDGTTIQNQNQVVYSNSTPGQYGFAINVVTQNSCTSLFTFDDVFEVIEIPNAEFTYSVSDSEFGYVIQLTNESTSFTNLLWNYNVNESSDETNPWFIAAQNINSIQLIAYNSSCSDTIIKTVELEDLEVIIPNIITNPGSDSPNSTLTLYHDSFKNFKVEILNRWGIQLYEGLRDESKPLYLWNGIDKQTGKKCTDGVYFIILSGELKNNENFKFHGFVTIAGA